MVKAEIVFSTEGHDPNELYCPCEQCRYEDFSRWCDRQDARMGYGLKHLLSELATAAAILFFLLAVGFKAHSLFHWK